MSKLIKKEGKFYKECGVLMLERPATKSNLIINKRYEKSYINSVVDFYKSYGDEYIHLYFTSDDEIKEGDWYLEFSEKGIHLHEEPCKDEAEIIKKFTSEKLYAKKIIATTDKLCVGHEDDYDERSKTGGNPIWLSQPSDKFIQAYIDAYNKGEKIEKVLVEYEQTYKAYPVSFTTIYYYYPKLKDNNIIIKKVKDSWSREEVIAIYKQGAKDYCNSSQGIETFLSKKGDGTKWIEENL